MYITDHLVGSRRLLTALNFCMYFRGKTTGHDIDLLISHPDEGSERGVLVQLMERLDRRGMVLHGSITPNTYTKEVLKRNHKSNLTTTMDYFEKWMGILKVNSALKQSSVKSELDNNHKEAGDNESNSHCDVIPQDYDVIPPSCKRQLSVGMSSPGNDPLDSLELQKPKFERKSSLTTAFDQLTSDRDWIARRVDLIIVPASQYYYGLVGWTGNRQYNR